jgi:uncharacterized protein
MKRIYEDILQEHLLEERQMAFVAGPRQVGKTTLLKALLNKGDVAFNWDRPAERELILQGSDALLERVGWWDLRSADAPKFRLAFDEIHKFRYWKRFLKGLFDATDGKASILVTGSARLNIYKRGGDSLMGRYFLYRMHPLSVGELTDRTRKAEALTVLPVPVDEASFEALMRFGGFPEPFLRATDRFHRRWSDLRLEQLFREDLRDLTRVQDIDQLISLSRLLITQSGQLANFSTLAKQISVTVDTIRRWLDVLESFYFSHRIRPWFKNVSKSLRKQPKIYPTDWSVVQDPGARCECFVAGHFLKAVNYWTDCGLGKFALHYLRDTYQREVDFLIVRDGCPWMLVEVKLSSKEPLSPALKHFAKELNVPYAFQAVLDMEYVDADCFAAPQGNPLRVPLRTLLAQLV